MAFGKGRSSTQGTDRRWLSKLLLVPVLLRINRQMEVHVLLFH